MKTPSLSLAVCAAAILALSTDAQLPCYDLGPGRACTNYLGEESRCSQTELCMTSLKECSSDAKLLQTCSSAFTSLKYLKFCYPMLGEGKPMQCMETEDIDTLVKRDQCVDKSDGTPCKSAYTEADASTGKTAAVYEEEGACEAGYCTSTFFTTCTDDSVGASCTVKGVLSGTLREFKGTCVTRTPYRARCNITGSGDVLRSATVLIGSAPVPTTAAPSKTPAPTSAKTPSPVFGEDADADNNNSGISSLFTLPPASSSSSSSKTPTPTPSSSSSSSERPLASVAVCTAALLSVSLVLMVA